MPGLIKIDSLKYISFFFFVAFGTELYSIHDPIYLCKGDGVVYFTDTTGRQGVPNSWDWVMEGGSPATDNKDTTDPVFYNTAGTYKTYNRTGFVGGGYDYDTFVIIVVDWPMPGFYFPTDTVYCKGAGVSVTLNTVSFPPNLKYLWSTGATSSSISVNTPGNYSVTLRVYADTNVCQTVTKQVNVTEALSPAVNLGQDKFMCQNQVFLLDAGAGTSYTYVWSPNGEVTQTLSVTLPGVYKVRVTNKDKCFSEDEINLQDSCPHYIFVPNAVSPNEDRLNDLFAKVWNFTPKEYTFRIFNRWGELLFETNDLNTGWDCKVNDSPVCQDIYIYKITYLDNDKQWYEMRGTFFVVR